MADPIRDELEARVLFEEGGLLAVDKWPRLPTSGRKLDDPDCLQFRLMERQGGMVWAVHQLDADTSGVNLFTTRKELVEPLKRAMEEKRYRALVRGVPGWDEVVCEAPIGELAPGQLGVSEKGRAARTRFVRGARCRGVEAPASELFVWLGTGRTHQVRIHASHLGHPLLGEEWYAETSCELHHRQALHAERLVLGGSFGVTIEAPLPEDLAQLLGSP